MDKSTRKQLFFLSLMLFSMFFGAGNLIFPPFMGQNAGTNFVPAMVGFLITSVGFPVLGIVVISRFGGMENLASRVGKRFSGIFSILIYLALGPCLAIPRAASMPYEMITTAYTPKSFSPETGLVVFSILFFALCFWLSLHPSKLVDSLGKIMTPALILLILVFCAAGLFKPLGDFAAPQGAYASAPFFTGFLEGYLTMDTVAALNFGIVIAMSIRDMGLKDEKQVIRANISTGIAAGAILGLTYISLGWLGAGASGRFAIGGNGAVTLADIASYFFGAPGIILLVAIFLLACPTTCIGLMTSCSEYFSSRTKLSYRTWLIIVTVWSMVIANFGLTKILAFSVPILNILHPVAIVLILLGLADRLWKDNRLVYPLTVAATFAVSIIHTLSDLGLSIPGLTPLAQRLPLYSMTLEWVPTAVCAIALSLILVPFIKKK